MFAIVLGTGGTLHYFRRLNKKDPEKYSAKYFARTLIIASAILIPIFIVLMGIAFSSYILSDSLPGL